jgi:PAS domain S-box-containing protein
MSETPGSTPSELAAEEARIGAELLGLDKSTDPFVSAVRATRMPMIVTNPRLPDNPVVFANDAFIRLTGYRREEILGRNCRFLQGPESDRAAIRRIHDAIAAREPIEIDIRNHRKDGTTFWNRLLIAPVRDAAGELAYFFASQLDVTPERERLAGLESHNAALLAELNERLRSLRKARPASASPPKPAASASGSSTSGPARSTLRRSAGPISASAPTVPSPMRRCAPPSTPPTARASKPPSRRASAPARSSASNAGSAGRMAALAGSSCAPASSAMPTAAASHGRHLARHHGPQAGGGAGPGPARARRPLPQPRPPG